MSHPLTARRCIFTADCSRPDYTEGGACKGAGHSHICVKRQTTLNLQLSLRSLRSMRADVPGAPLGSRPPSPHPHRAHSITARDPHLTPRRRP
ncbi:hypothetical protein BASA62_001333 [Batrachochytrium salamandrivorans]|nr:hypothetical protein BASA62_001333 [Batrachochytrium salamandrivorans]